VKRRQRVEFNNIKIRENVEDPPKHDFACQAEEQDKLARIIELIRDLEGTEAYDEFLTLKTVRDRI